MIRIGLTVAYDVIASTLLKDAARWPMQRDRGQCFIQVGGGGGRPHEGHRGPCESYSEVILNSSN
jgi:hypothetical protein